MSLEEKLDIFMKGVPEREPFRIEWFANHLGIIFEGSQMGKFVGLLTISYGYAEKVSTGTIRFALTDKGRKCQRAGGHLLFKKIMEVEEERDEREQEDERMHRWYNRQDAKQRFEDYPTVVKQRNFFIMAEIITVIVAILALIFKK